MFTLRQIKKEDYIEVESIIKNNRIEDNLSQGITYILKDNNDMIGVGKIILRDDYGILKYIFVKEDCRGYNYGDAILRGLLYKCQSIGVNKIFSYKDDAYLLKKGFTYKEGDYSMEQKLYLGVDDFFKKSYCGDKN